MESIQFAIISVVLFFAVFGIIFTSTSGYIVQNSLLYPQLNLLGGYWFATATATPIPAEIEFLDDGTFVVTVRNEKGKVDETHVGYYELDMANRKLEMKISSEVIKLSLYDVQIDSFRGSSAEHDLLMSFQRRF